MNVKGVKEESLQMRIERSQAVRANIKRFYIYFVLALIVILFSVVKLGQVEMFGRGHFLSPASIINLLRTAVPIMTLSGAFTLLMISGYIDLSVGSAMSLSAVVFALMILNGFPFLPALVIVLIMGGMTFSALPLMADSPCGTISSAMPLNRFSVTSVAITGVMRSFMTRSPLRDPIAIPMINVMTRAGRNENPLRIIRANTTAFKLIALPTDRSM